MKGNWITIFAVLITLASVPSANAQYHTEYGQNRIQYKNFDWVYYSTNHFEIYHYQGGKDYAEQAIEFLEDEFNTITDLLGYAPYSKTKIFIYNSIHDLQQSNIGIEGAEFGLSGQTDFVKLQIEIAHPGLAVQFREELVYKLSRILIEEMLFGGSLAEIFQSSYLLNLPRWFIDGAARYLAYGWSIEMDDFVRNYLSEKRVRKLVNVKGDQSGLLGQSVWNFIALKYGKSNVSNILNLTRIIRNEENSIASTLGLTYKQFMEEWKSYYLSIEEEIKENYLEPDVEQMVIAERNPQIKYKNVRISPSGKKIAYSHNILGQYKVFVYDNDTESIVKVNSGGWRFKGQKVDYSMPLLDWADDKTLGMVYFKRGYLYLSTIDLETKKRIDKPLPRFNKIESFSFNENGRLALISGEIDGFSDIYLVSMRRNAIRRITKDVYDDEGPVFVPGTAAIVFSSNRPADSIDISDQSIKDLTSNFNLFLYDLDTTIHSYHRITNTFSRDYKPIAKSPYEIFYLSDQRGINNLFKYSFIDSTYSQVTHFERSIKDYDIQFGNDKLVYLMLDGGGDKVFLDTTINLNDNHFSSQTARQRYLQAQYITNIYNRKQVEKAKNKEKALQPEISVKIELPLDSIAQKDGENQVDTLKARDPGLDPDTFVFDKIKSTDEEIIDTDNYKFSESVNVEKYRPESFFTNYERLEVSSQVIGPIAYEPQFSFTNFTTSFAIDPLRGRGSGAGMAAVLEAQVNDVMGNYQFNGGGLIMTDLNDGDIYAEFSYLKYWMDLKLRVERSDYFFEDNNEDVLRQRYVYNKVQLGSAIPLSNWFRFEFNPFLEQTNFSNLQYSTIINRNTEGYAEDRRVNYLGASLRAVFDNTIDKGYNIVQGTKGAVELHHHQSITSPSLTFTNLRVDFRHYQKVHREITLATRFFYGESFGPSRQKFLVGGVPNWLFSEFKSHDYNDPLQVSNTTNNAGILFSEFVNNLRGFDYNEKFGTSSLLFNAELRLPLFEYLSRAPVNSDFLRNFSFVGFFDFGSAWDGPIPLNAETGANTIRYIDDSGFVAEISNFRNPWLASYGLGARTVLMDYYVKFEYAIPVEEFVAQDRRLLLSIGLDF